MTQEMPERNLFMMCKTLREEALADLPKGYIVRHCRPDELDLWKAMPFDDDESAQKNNSFINDFFNKVYGKQKKLFFQKCLFLCDKNETPIGTCFAWKAYNKMTTIHWFKILKEFEGEGLGRVLLSYVMKNIPESDYPVYLHTQPESYKAIKLYTEFGFSFLTDPIIGYRENHLEESLPALKQTMYQEDFNQLKFEKAPNSFLDAVKSSKINEF